MQSSLSSDQRGFGIVEGLLILAAVILIGGIGFYVYQSKQVYQNWRTQQSSKGHYTLKMPDGWQATPRDRGNGWDTLEVSHGPEVSYEFSYFDEASIRPVDLQNGLYDIEGVHRRSLETRSGLIVQEYFHKKECPDNPGLTAGVCAKGESYVYDVPKGTKHVRVYVLAPSENSKTLEAMVKSIDIK